MSFYVPPENPFFVSQDESTLHFIKKFDERDEPKAINKVLYGTGIKKLLKKGKSHKLTFFYINEDDNGLLQWISRKKSYTKSRIDLRDIRNITEEPTDYKIMPDSKTRNEIKCILCIDYGVKKTLTLEFPDEKEKRLWWHGLQIFIEKIRLKHTSSHIDILAHTLFMQADKDGSKKLDLKEIIWVLEQMNIHVKLKNLTEIISKYDKNNDENFEFGEFKAVLRNLMFKKELVDVFADCVGDRKFETENDTPVMNPSQLNDFFKKYQGEFYAIPQLQEIIKYFAQDEKRTLLSFIEFTQLVFSIHNQAFEPAKTRIYQDMTRPLTDYYMASSHNTYLMANQLTGESSVKAYINVFNKGCRCVELDCWDGDKGEPVITHGHTLTSKILFQDVIQAIKDYGFKTSPYPVVLSIENHCSKKQQDKMASIFEKILGDDLFILPQNYEDFPLTLSPEDLKGKVLLKGKGSFKGALDFLKKSKKAKKFNPSANYTKMRNDNFIPNSELSTDLKDTELTEHGKPTKVPTPVARNINFFSAKMHPDSQPDGPPKQTTHPVRLQERGNTEEINEEISDEDGEGEGEEEKKKGDANAVAENNKEKAGKKPAHHSASSSSLVQLITLFSKRYSPGDASLGTWHISSIEETKLKKHLKSNREKDLTDYTKRNFVKLYPLGLRFDSSNFDTVPGFYIGAQVIAMNYQKSDIHMLIYYSKFIQNGGLKSGYILKPNFMLYNCQNPLYASDFTQVSMTLEINIISAQHLRVSNRVGSNKNKDIVDPFIEVSLRGVPLDEENNIPYKTAVVQDNGFNPQWKESVVTFKIRAPEFDFIIFQAWDKDNLNDERLGWACIPTSCIRPGYRVIPLRDDNLELINNSFVFCHIKISRTAGK